LKTNKPKKYKWGEKPPEEKQQQKKKHGRCAKCDSGRFTLNVENGQMIRTCEGCGDFKAV
jgi:hypothetical protein